MKKRSKQLFRDLKKQAHQNEDTELNKVEDTLEKVELYQAFKKQAVKVEKVTSEHINLDTPIYGILDSNFKTMTFRANEYLVADDLLMIDQIVYKVESIRDDSIHHPIVIDEVEHQAECKVAVIKKV